MPAGSIHTMPTLDLAFQLADLAVEFLQVVAKAREQLTEHSWQIALHVLQYLRQTLGNLLDPLRNDDAVFEQEPADLIGLGRARLDETLAGPDAAPVLLAARTGRQRDTASRRRTRLRPILSTCGIPAIDD
ncbi:hypothetical protein AZKH_2304 [Azoarcus sp. KH32C]|nr:hypothetical protein AZKH_2304 [Azoarcus sp. KH32C]